MGYTLGDEWNDPVPVKVVKDGNSYWRYRIPAPSDPDYKSRVRGDNRGADGRLEGHAGRQRLEGRGSSIWAPSRPRATASSSISTAPCRSGPPALDWFLEEWGRDTFISLPGLLLSTGRYAEAKENMRQFAKHEHDGLIPNRIRDASRWTPASPTGGVQHGGRLPVVRAGGQEIRGGHQGRRFRRRDAAGAAPGHGPLRLGHRLQRYGRFNRIYMDSDGLIVSPAQATWMDADPEGRDKPVTPRNGKAVEINALWYANLRFLARQERQLRQRRPRPRPWTSRADLVKKSFNDKFWFETEDNKKAWGGSGGALADVIEGDPHGQAVRPNMLIAVSRGEDLLSPERQAAVVQAATRDLLTPYGMRTLSYRDSHYNATYDTSQPPIVKDQAYHQGTVWPWLMGPYVDALVRVRRAQGWDEGRIRDEVRGVMTPLVEFLVSQPEGSLPEVFDGGQPQDALLRFSLADPLGLRDVIVKVLRSQNRGGTRSQAWSVAEAIRVLVEYGLAPAP